MNTHGSLEKFHDLSPSTAEFRAGVINGLSSPRKNLPCKFFYDEEGSRLFDRICEQPEYYPTRTECNILERHCANIAEHIGPHAKLVEFGSGAGIKIRLLLRALDHPAAYIPVDISQEFLLSASLDLSKHFPALRIAPICADYTKQFRIPTITGATKAPYTGFFPGSTIGNFTPMEATAFLFRTRNLLGPGSLMIVGVDLVKDETTLTNAYNDAAGVTAAFNLNLLVRINRELQGTFDLSQFAHEAIWNTNLSRIEMHLVSQCRQTVFVGANRFHFEAGESIHTENSYKYGVEQFRHLADQAGYAPVACWTDPKALFSVHMLRAV